MGLIQKAISGLYNQTFSFLDLQQGGGGRLSGAEQTGFIFIDQSSRTNSGEIVTVDNMLEEPTTMSCVNAIVQGINQIPVAVKRESDDGNFEVLKDHPVAKLMRRPNDFQTAAEFKSSIVTSMLTHGNAFIYIQRASSSSSAGKPLSSSGAPRQLLPMDASDITIGSNQFGVPVYNHEEHGQIDIKNIIHIRDLTTYVPQGLSRAILAAELIGAKKAADRLMAETFRNGVSLQYAITSEVPMDAAKTENLMKQMQSVFTARGNRRGGVALLDQGSIEKLEGLKPADVDLRELREQLIREIAAAFRVPAFMVGSDAGQTYNNVRQYWTAFHRDTLQPLITNIEEAISLKLLGDGEMLHFDVTEILKGDIEVTSRVVSQLVSNGIYTPNEAREQLGKPRNDQAIADMLIAPNSTTNTNIDDADETPGNATGGEDGPQGADNITDTDQARVENG